MRDSGSVSNSPTNTEVPMKRWLFDAYFVEADDEGWLWQPEQAERALKERMRFL